MARSDGRRSDRFRVRLTVRYESAAEFVREYAENLSAGGLFIAGVTHLQPLEEMTVEVDLPGLGTYRITAEVAHILDAESARRAGRTAGAGMSIRDASPEFHDALGIYLQRLGSRADQLIMVEPPLLQVSLASAGYRVEVAPDPGGLIAAIARLEQPVLRVVVGAKNGVPYREAARQAGDDDLVLVCDEPADLDAVLTSLDELL
ncbi:MAG TPA: PilZ domain-containing protein [Kofleriaceae bacterium]|nr:PilZ domain-containing protein [Kofleriaceae bacterium]